MRLDRLLAHNGAGSRKDASKLIKSKKVKVNGSVVTEPNFYVDENADEIFVGDKAIVYKKFRYYMLNKPKGVVSATEDSSDKTVVELLSEEDRRDVFPVGRLDKDTTGLLLLTNDGQTAHRLLSPRKHVDKKYLVYLEKAVSKDDVKSFADGLKVDAGFTAQSALLEIVSEDAKEVHVTIHEGKFHQIKRMFAAVGNKVLELKRVSMGALLLDENLPEGAYRQLTQEEIELLEMR